MGLDDRRSYTRYGLGSSARCDPLLLGVTALILAVAGVVMARRRFTSTYFAALGGAALVLAMPWSTPLHSVMFAVLPKFEELHNHWPERVAIVSYLAIAMLAGMAVESLRRNNISRNRIYIAFGLPVAEPALVGGRQRSVHDNALRVHGRIAAGPTRRPDHAPASSDPGSRS
ncbi:MAG: hypothetical protein R2845_08115 [Thermomicrobiales bacterium]